MTPRLTSSLSPEALRGLDHGELAELAAAIREFLVRNVSRTGGHLGSNLGAVELTLALHRVYDSPHDVVLWDTGHQAYVHKIVTGRAGGFDRLRQGGGMSGYPNREESPHDWIENSHASTVLSYAHGFAEGFACLRDRRRVVAVIGDGSLTGGMAFEGLNNLGRSGRRVLVVLNDNGRSYAPTASRLPDRLRRGKAAQLQDHQRRRLARVLSRADGRQLGATASAELQAIFLALGDSPRPESFFQSLGIRYLGPVDGHSVGETEAALRAADRYDGPTLLHVITRKGKGHPFAEEDEEKCLHDVSVFDPATGPGASAPSGMTGAFSDAMVEYAATDDRIHAITAAMPGPTGLLPFQRAYPDRFHDVGIAEQHAVTMAAGMAMTGLRPVVAVYSTFLSRAFDQLNLDVGLHGLPVVFALDRAGVTGDDGPSHHGILDMALCSRVPGMTVLAPASPDDLRAMLRYALTLPGPAVLRWQKGAPATVPGAAGPDGSARRLATTGEDVCVLAAGRMVAPALGAATALGESADLGVTVWNMRCVKPLDPEMLADAARHRLVVTVEDGLAGGGAGSAVAMALTGHEVVTLGVPDAYLAHGNAQTILSRIGLDADGIAASVRRYWAGRGARVR